MLGAPSLTPLVQTDRLVLRGHRREDFRDCFALWSNPDVTRYIGGRPSTEEEVWARLLRNVGHWAILGYGYWVVTERANGRFLGEIGFADFHRDMTPSFGDAPEAGWVLLPGEHGQGYASEALRAAHAWLTGHLGAVRTVCMIAPENIPSLRVAEKAGYKEWTRGEFKGAKSILFERTPG